ncbi:MAG TPA: GTP-binding protein [Acidobacteriota bacterium]|nr:GTP-binding protein [Acidobacteriota bacterium]
MSLDVFSRIRSWVPKELLNLLDQIVYFFPQETRLSLKRVVDTLPPTPDNVSKVYEMVREQWKDLWGRDQVNIAVVGPGQTGKSGLVRALTSRQANNAVNFAVVDVQGLDEYLGYRGETQFSDELAAADVVLLVLDAQYAISESTVRLYRKLSETPAQLVVVLNKIDTVERPRDVIKAASRQLRTTVIPMSLLEEERIDDLLKAIVAVCPRSLYPLSRAFPDFRQALGRQIVNEATFAATIAGALRIPFPLFMPVAALHGAMILKLARAYGLNLDSDRARELIPLLALDLAFDRGAQYLRERFPERRTLITASVSGAYTFALGQAAIRYFEWITGLLDTAQVLPGPGSDQFSWRKD